MGPGLTELQGQRVQESDFYSTNNQIKSPKFSLTKLSSSDGEVPIKDDPLLDALSIGGGLLIDSVDSLLDGSVDLAIFATCDLRDTCGIAAQFTAELNGFWCQLVLWTA